MFQVKAEAKGMLSEGVEDALEHVDVKPEVKVEEDFAEEEEAEMEVNHDVDYMVNIMCGISFRIGDRLYQQIGVDTFWHWHSDSAR